jgi:preprotein translocase subunit SecA
VAEPSLSARRLREQALALAELLSAGHDFAFDEEEQRVRLTPWGAVRALDLARPLGADWASKLEREDRLERAVFAQRVMHCGVHYRIEQGRIQPLDPRTGEAVAEESWERGIAELVALKECLPQESELDVRARLSLSTFFRRYLQLGGVCAAADRGAGELWERYRLPVVRGARPDFQERLFATARARDAALVLCVRGQRLLGHAVVIVARTQPHAAALAEQLRTQRVPLESAGGAVLGCGAVRLISSADGDLAPLRIEPSARGLYAVLAERAPGARHEQQLLLRLGRDAPLKALLLASLEDALFEPAPAVASRLASLADVAGLVRPLWIGRLALRRAQRSAEAPARGQRRYLEALDEHVEAALERSSS